VKTLAGSTPNAVTGVPFLEKVIIICCATAAFLYIPIILLHSLSNKIIFTITPRTLLNKT
jgi:hypothetical protein